MHSSRVSSSTPVISTIDSLAEVAYQVGRVDALGLDTEFLRERTYRAELCLLQLTTPRGPVCVDPLALPELGALAALLGTRSGAATASTAGQPAPPPYTLTLSYQGCADAGVCYPPREDVLVLDRRTGESVPAQAKPGSGRSLVEELSGGSPSSR